MLKIPIQVPTLDFIAASAESKNDSEIDVAEEALQELFSAYPKNSDHRHVLLKTVSLNTLYSTQIRSSTNTIPNVHDVAHHIYSRCDVIDASLQNGDPDIVDLIADIKIPPKTARRFISFASKYCSWHRPDLYPIYDTRVFNYLNALRRIEPFFTTNFKLHKDNWRYEDFRTVMQDFRSFYKLKSLSWKEIDKFLWIYGETVQAKSQK